MRACNLNKDDKCDEQDMAILERSMGQCNQQGNYTYNQDADLDNDNCITEKDKNNLEASMGRAGYICPPSYPGILGL